MCGRHKHRRDVTHTGGRCVSGMHDANYQLLAVVMCCFSVESTCKDVKLHPNLLAWQRSSDQLIF